MNDKKIIAYDYAWKCRTMDFLSNIEKEYYKVLFDNNTTELIPMDEFNVFKAQYEIANNEELNNFLLKRGYLQIGDKVKICRGRKFVGEIKEIQKFFKYNIQGTYGKEYVNYVVFTDGTKVNIDNVIPTIQTFENVNHCLQFQKHLLNIGGRI